MRWGTVYDFEGLKSEIQSLIDNDGFQTKFYLVTSPAGSPTDLCTGDIVKMSAKQPLFNERGRAVTAAETTEHWLLLGNTCDMDRPIEEVRFTQLLPLVDLGRTETLGSTTLGHLKTYDAYRGFYVPPWPGGDDHHRLADFTAPVTMHRHAFESAARVVARMEYVAWALLHSCTVRFLARDDGRHE